MIKCFFLIIIAFSALGWISVLIFDMQSKGEWCQRTPTQLGSQCHTLVSVVQQLNHHNISNWLCYGSALAAIRPKVKAGRDVPAFPIPWESDDDLCIYEQDSKTIEHVLSLLAQQIPIQIEVLIGNVVRYRVSRTDDEAGQEWGIDMYAHRESTFYETQVMIQNVAANRERTHRDFPKHVIEPLSTKNNYCGSSIFSLPNERIQYVSHLFGKTWKVPLASFTGTNGYRRLTCLLSSPFSNNVPRLRPQEERTRVYEEA